jgi:hypothetical protein
MPMSPVQVVPDLLPQALRDAVFTALVGAQGAFGIGGTTIGLRLDGRRTHVLADVGGVLGEQLAGAFAERLSAAVRAAKPALGLEGKPIKELEVQASVYLDGGFYQPHRDIGPNNTRRVTWIYYLHAQPKRFTGGELVVYDSDLPGTTWTDERGFRTEGTLTVPPNDNQLVMFLSEYFHEVCVVRCDPERFADARFTLNGWLHTADAPQP